MLEERVKKTEAIEVITGVTPSSFSESNAGIDITFSKDELETINCDSALVAVGRKPDNCYISEELLNKPCGVIPLHFAGDVVNGSFRQVGIAVGDGLRCAMDIAAMLEEKT